MGRKAELAVELKVALAEAKGLQALGGWLRRNAGEVLEALDWPDDLVEIQEVNVNDLPQLLRELGRA